MPETNIKNDLKKLSEIAQWFEAQKELDLNEALKKVKEAALVIKQSRAKLKEVENEFIEIKRDIES